MKAAAFYKVITMDESGFLEGLLVLFEQEGIRWCVVGGQAVNAYVEPLVSLDLDLAVATADLPRLERVLDDRFKVERHPHSLNVSQTGSGLRVQIQTDARYSGFVERSAIRQVLGTPMPVADVSDVLQGKVWAGLDPARRPSKRRKDLLDIERLLERYPELRERTPAEILERLER